MPDNILLTRLEIDEASYKTQLESIYVQPSKKAASTVEKNFKEADAAIGSSAQKPTISRYWKNEEAEVKRSISEIKKTVASVSNASRPTNNPGKESLERITGRSSGEKPSLLIDAEKLYGASRFNDAAAFTKIGQEAENAAGRIAKVGTQTEQVALKFGRIRGYGAIFRAANLGINETELNAGLSIIEKIAGSTGGKTDSATRLAALLRVKETGLAVTRAETVANLAEAAAETGDAAAKGAATAASVSLTAAKRAETAATVALTEAESASAIGFTAIKAAVIAVSAPLTLLAVGAAAVYHITSDIRTEAERRLKLEEKIAFTYGDQLSKQRQSIALFNEQEVLAQRSREFSRFESGASVEELIKRRDETQKRLELLPATTEGLSKNQQDVLNPIINAARGELSSLNAAIDEAKQKKIKTSDESFNQRTDDFKKNQLDRINAEKKGAENNKKESDELKKKVETIRNLRNEVKDVLLSATDAARDNNPFLKIFSEAESAIERFEQRFKLFGLTFAREMAKIELQKLAGEAAQIRYQSSSRALGFQQQARQLELLPERKTTDFKNAVERVQLQASGYTEIFSLQKQIRDLEGTTVAGDLSRLGNFQSDIQQSRAVEDFQNELKELSKDKTPEGRKKFNRRRQDFGIFKREKELSDRGDQEKVRDALEQAKFLRQINLEGTGVYGDQIIAKEIAAVLNPVKDIRTDSNSAQTINRGLRGANRSLIAGKRQEIYDKIADQQFVEYERANALEKLKNLQGATGLTARQRNAEFLNITSELGNENLTPALRKARIEALNDASRLEKQSEKEMLDAVKAVAKVMGKIDKIVTEKGLNVNLSEVPLLDLTVSDKLSVNTENGLPSTPNPGDTAKEMGKDNYRWVDDRTEKK